MKTETANFWWHLYITATMHFGMYITNKNKEDKMLS